MIELSIITAGYCSEETMPRCLESINQQINCSLEFIYIENAHQSPSTSIVKQHYPLAIIIEPGDNLGFSKACNLGAQSATGEYLLFLNPDCEINTIETLKNMLQFMRSNPKTGICCPLYMSHKGKVISDIRPHYFGSNRHTAHHFNQLPGNYAWASGAALMISKQLFKQIGGFDEQYFMYFEDVDLGLTVRKAGYEVSEVANTLVRHQGGLSAKKAWTRSKRILKVELSRRIFTAKNYSPNEHKKIWKKYRVKKLLDVIKSYLFLQRKRLPLNWIKLQLANRIYRGIK